MDVEMEENVIPRILETREAANALEVEPDLVDILSAASDALRRKEKKPSSSAAVRVLFSSCRAGIPLEPDLANILSAASDALRRKDKKWYSREIALQEENNRTLKATLDDESRRLTSAEMDLEECRGRLLELERDLDAALIDAKEVRRRLAFTRKHAHNTTRTTLQALDAMVITMKVQQEKVEAESKGLREAANARVKKRKLDTDFAIVKTKLEDDLLRLGKRLNDVEKNSQSLQKNLEEEKEKSLCQICLENPKDTTAFPCLHLNFCFSCLEAHRIRTGTCPTCRVTITGILKCVLYV